MKKKMPEKMLRKMARLYPLSKILEVLEDEKKKTAQEMAERGIRCTENDAFACSAALFEQARNLKKCAADNHRYIACPCWVGGKAKWL